MSCDTRFWKVVVVYKNCGNDVCKAMGIIKVKAWRTRNKEGVDDVLFGRGILDVAALVLPCIEVFLTRHDAGKFVLLGRLLDVLGDERLELWMC